MVLRKLTLVVLSAFLIISLTVGSIGLSLQTLLYPDIYITALDKNDAYDLIEQQLMEEGFIPATIFAEQGVKATIDRFIKSTLAYIRGDAADWELTINMTIQSFFEERAAEIEVCSPDYDPLTDELCRPPDMDPDEFLDMLYEIEGIDNSEFSVDLAEVLEINQSLQQVRSGVQIFRKVIILTLIIALANIFLIFILTKKSIIAMTEWIDGDLFMVSLSMFIFSYFVKQNLTRILPPGILEGLLTSIAYTVLDLMNFYGLVIMGIGVALILITGVVKLLERYNK